MSNVKDFIPQREPFLFVDEIVESGQDYIITKKHLTGDEDFFGGHFPTNPVFPGVLMCEAAFQSGAILMGIKGDDGQFGKTAVVTRIQNAKFKNMVKPPCTLEIKVDFKEMLVHAAFFKAKLTTNDKTCLTIDFSCALISEES